MKAVQCRMARAALQLGVRELAALAQVSTGTITKLERGEALLPRTAEAVQRALEAQASSSSTIRQVRGFEAPKSQRRGAAKQHALTGTAGLGHVSFEDQGQKSIGHIARREHAQPGYGSPTGGNNRVRGYAAGVPAWPCNATRLTTWRGALRRQKAAAPYVHPKLAAIQMRRCFGSGSSMSVAAMPTPGSRTSCARFMCASGRSGS